MINKRLCGLSSNAEVFKESTPIYDAALKKSGYKEKLVFKREVPKQRQRKRKITWFNPPFNAACTVNIGREFLKLIDKHFPPNKKRKDKLEKIINRHTVKISYSGTPNMAMIISAHNKKSIAREKNEREAKSEGVQLPEGC